MNDLTFCTTLLSCFVMLVASVIIAVAAVSAVPQRASTAASRPDRVAAHAAKTATKDCTGAAPAPTSPVDER